MTLKHATKNFSGLVAVNDVSFDMTETGVHALIGPNGSGKTTIVNMITGVCRANGGSIQFDGHELTGMAPQQIASLGLRRTYQNLKLFRKLTVMENIMVGAQHNASLGFFRTVFDGRAARTEERYLRERAEQTIEMLGLQNSANRIATSEPYGIQKLTAVGVALVDTPKLLLLDEPAAGLNPSERMAFINIIQKIQELGVRIFIIEHNMDVVMSISSKITVLNFGAKIAEGTPDEIKANDEVVHAYLGRRFHKAEGDASC